MKLVVAFAPGGVADIMGRLVAQLLQHKLGGTFIVENKPGGDGLIGMGEVVRAQPDGYTLLIGGFGGQIVPPLMKDDFPFDVRRDIVKIAMTAEFANVLVVNKDLPVNSVSELIAYLKERPGKLNFGSSGRATSDRLAAEMFMLETGTRMLNVPYRGGGVALNDMLAGTTQVMFPQLPAVISLATSGTVKPLGRHQQLPALATAGGADIERDGVARLSRRELEHAVRAARIAGADPQDPERCLGGGDQGAAVPGADAEDRRRAGRPCVRRGRGVLRARARALEAGNRYRQAQTGKLTHDPEKRQLAPLLLDHVPDHRRDVRPAESS